MARRTINSGKKIWFMDGAKLRSGVIVYPIEPLLGDPIYCVAIYYGTGYILENIRESQVLLRNKHHVTPRTYIQD